MASDNSRPKMKPSSEGVSRYYPTIVILLVAVFGGFALYFGFYKIKSSIFSQPDMQGIISTAELTITAASVTIACVFILTFALAGVNAWQLHLQRQEIDRRVDSDGEKLHDMEIRLNSLKKELAAAEAKMDLLKTPSEIMDDARSLIDNKISSLTNELNRRYLPAEDLAEKLKREVQLSFFERLYQSALGSALIAEAVGDSGNGGKASTRKS